MSDKNLIINQQTPGAIISNKLQKKAKKDTFTKLQSAVLILLTLVISVGGWYAVGNYFFWNKIDGNRVNAQLDYLKQKVAAQPTDAKARIELGYTYYLKGKNDEALKELNQALSLDPKNFDAYYNIGLVLLRTGQYNEALEKLAKAVEISPRDYKAHMQQGVAYRNLKMYKEASAALAQANKLMPGSADIIYETGKVAEDQGAKDAAIELYKEALSYDPLYKDALKALEQLQK